MQRDTRLISDRRQELEFRLAELVGGRAVHIQHAENRFGRPHRRTHDRPDALLHDALAGDISQVGERVVGESGDAVLENVADDGVRQDHVARAAGARSCTDGNDLDFGRQVAFTGRETVGRAHENRGAAAAGDLENRGQDRIEQPFDAGRA